MTYIILTFVIIFGVAILLSTTVAFIPYALAWDKQKNTHSIDEVKHTSSKIKGAKGETGEQGPQRPLASITGTLLIKIRVDNTKGGALSASDFNVGIEGTSPHPQQFQGPEPYTIIQIGKGNYNVSQEIENGYSLSLDGECSGSIKVGEIKTCTLFNTFAG